MKARPVINRQPLGILDFLGIKNGGEYPHALSEDLLATWDMSRFYLDNAATQTRTTGTLNNATRGTTISVGSAVPVGQIWAVDLVSFTTALFAAGQTCKVAFYLQRAGLATEQIILPGNYYAGPIGAGGLETYSVGANVGRLLYPGDSIGFKVDQCTDGGSTIAYSSVLRYAPLVSSL